MSNLINRRMFVILAMLAGIAILFFVVERYWPLVPDYYYHYRPLADEWVSGSWRFYEDVQLYLGYPPWSAVFIAPLGLLSLDAGKAALFVLTVVCAVASLRLIYDQWRIPPWVLFASLANLFMLDVLLRGQLDTVALFGLVLAWWSARRHRPWLLGLALCLATVKPPANIVLPLLAVLYELRRWAWRDIAKTAAWPILAVAGSFAVFGLNWPFEFVKNLQGPINYLSISVWRAGGLLGISPVWIGALCAGLILFVLREVRRSPLDLRILSTSIAVNLLVTTYANGDHYVLLIPAFAYVAMINRKWSVVAYALTFTPVLCIALGYDAAVADLLFPALLLACAWFLPNRPAQDQERPRDEAVRPAMV